MDGIVIEGYRANKFMPKEIKGNIGLIVIEFFSEDEDDPILKIKSTDQFKSVHMKKLHRIEALISMLRQYHVRLVLIAGEERMDEQVLMRMANEKIICIQGLTKEQSRRICRACNIKPITPTGLSVFINLLITKENIKYVQ